MHNVEASVVTLTVSDHADTSHVATTGDHGDDAGVKVDEVCDLSCRQVDLDCVVDPDQRIGVTDPG